MKLFMGHLSGGVIWKIPLSLSTNINLAIDIEKTKE